MARTPTVTVNETGSIKLPPGLRRQFPRGSRFSVSANNGTIMLKEVPTPKPKTREEAMAQLMAASEAIARDFNARGITEAHIRRTIKRLRAEKRAQSNR